MYYFTMTVDDVAFPAIHIIVYRTLLDQAPYSDLDPHDFYLFPYVIQAITVNIVA